MMIDKYKTLIILDWDDTLFPTSWVTKNNIDITNPNIQRIFINLDKLIYQILQKMITYGHIVIVTNAAEKWIEISTNVLPKTQSILTKNISVLSARDTFEKSYPAQIHVWKKLLFKEIVNNYFKNHKLQNIISIGDAEYEFHALTDLYNENSAKKYRLLKTIRFIKEPDIDSLLDQLDVLNKTNHKIVNHKNHMDLTFTQA